jgi:tyrosyl-tRNA synthetase
VITAQYHGEAAARAAEANFVRVHQQRQAPAESIRVVALEAIQFDDSAGVRLAGKPLWQALKEAGLVESSSESWRMIQQGAVEVDGERVSDGGRLLEAGRDYLIKVGKRRFGRIMVREPQQGLDKV